MDSLQRRIVFRADGDGKIGLGHIMRCIALSEMVRTQYTCIFVVAQPSDILKEIISPFGEVIILNALDKEGQFRELDKILNPLDIVVTDGYHFDYDYQQFLKYKSAKLIMIDDLAEEFFCADLVINHGSSAISGQYRKDRNTKVLAGFDYLILRKEFLDAAKRIKKINKVNSVFICMGGADPSNITKKVVSACLKEEFVKRIVVVVGGVYAHREELVEFVDLNKENVEVSIQRNVSASMMVELIWGSDICIVPSSSIALEVCCVKSGILTGITFDNQNAIHNQLITDQCGLSLGNFNTVSVADITAKLKLLKSTLINQKMLDRQAKVVDGQSGNRILNEINSIVGC
ncbi:UDP-2,4-diacetamido-2,4,6-trideoxy-beta-L-altropyranose hydrolase [Pedobacter sp. HMWF019]|uniref:UDP-2,4-diacetamido-2,4, 6-trideoxy-beta-L-altropyranose hydrolase n=1 Tax=Pedobacter sp. HMWF019 TaxID=2056856 RepID=UPI000D3659F0|nr:UDP-2,4-diacetamido-2,4,6-trideoxy-beta-L-altropyranose hydrolase [Pedobacter sp. HMWF019]PTS95984.1 UDP-2,4-diacetamido-2,4,6-trideoxy-beta-L-altropyranose hydrolase [Pedobacter sp. HMWF019]